MTQSVSSEQNTRMQIVLLVDDDPIITEGLAMGLEREGRTVITCNDIESAELAVDWFKPGFIVTDVRLTGSFAYEGLDLIRYAKRHLPDSRVILMTGEAPEALQLEASERGAIAFLQKPFGGLELSAVIDVMNPLPSDATLPPVLIEMPLLDDVIVSPHLYTVFQPIVELGSSWEPYGHESLARYRTTGPLANPEKLFQYAGRKDMVCELELACISRTLDVSSALRDQGPLFLNIHPDVFAVGTRLFDLLAGYAADVTLENIVLEITEQAALQDSGAVLAHIERLRGLGVRFAFDDFGSAHSHLPFIDRVRPDFLKISQHYGMLFESNATKSKIITSVMSIAKDFGCEVILEGIEDSSTAEAGSKLGIRYGQGYLFGRPTEPGAFARSK
ncbi:MAG TPA: EAL domain-containing protein [Thermoanaerobaculia bacterium]|nr:EAL domain-containing protein [Thermoanaerobaculia bacterium]